MKHPLDVLNSALDDDRAVLAGLSLSAAGLLWGTMLSLTNPVFWMVLIPGAAPYFWLGLRPRRKNASLTIPKIIITYAAVGAPFVAGLGLSIILYKSTWSPLFLSPVIGSDVGLAAGIGYQLLRQHGERIG